MRIKTLAVASAIISLGCGTGFAQTADPSPACPPPPPGGEHMHGGRLPEFLQKLPPDVKARFIAARQKALEDPKMQDLKKQAEAANHAFFDAMRAKMEEIDPGLEDVIKQYIKRPEGGKGSGGRGGLGMDKLTQAERDQLKAAHEKAMNDPAVQAAEAGKKAATTPQDRRQAAEAFHQAMQEAMLKADPTVEPVLKKLEAHGPPPPPGAGGPDDTSAPPQ